MSAPPAAAGALPRLGVGRRQRLLAAYRAEQRKLLAQSSIRVTALACLLAPFLFAFLLSRQSGVPGDSLLGAWVHSSGYAVAFVVLDFAGYLGFPVLAGIVAGDLFSSEDRYGTWKTLLTRSRSRSEVFAAKALAGCALTCGLALLAAASSVAGGLLFVGSGHLVDLSGSSLSASEALPLLVSSWLLSLPPLIGFTAIAILLSLASRSGIVGVLGTALVGLLMQLLAFVGNGSWPGALLLGSAFDDWHGLLADPRFFAPLAIALLASAVWTIAALGGAWLLLRRREFAGQPVARRRGWIPLARPVLIAIAVLACLGIAASAGPTPITRSRLESSIASAFERLTVLQQHELARTVPPHAHLAMRTGCARRSSSVDGPGDDWTCTITLLASQSGWNPLNLTPVTYDVSVKPNGCYKAEAPPTFVGQQTMSDAHGHSVVNPLFAIYGCFDPTAASSCRDKAAVCTSGRAGSESLAPSASPTGAASPEREQELRRLHEAEKQAGPKVLREQEETVHKLEHESAVGEEPSG